MRDEETDIQCRQLFQYTMPKGSERKQKLMTCRQIQHRTEELSLEVEHMNLKDTK